MAIGAESEVTNAMEAVGQGVEQEAPDELVGVQTHGLYGAVVAIVLPGEPDMVVVAGLDAAVGDGDAMGVAAEIGENLRGSAEGLLGVDDPIEATHGGQMRRERGGIGQIGKIAEESEALRVEGGLHAFEEQAAEQPGKRLDRQKEVRAPRDPSGAIDGKSAAGDDAMDVRVGGASTPAPKCAGWPGRRSALRACGDWRPAWSRPQ